MARKKSADQIEALRKLQAEIAAKLKEAEAKERARKKDEDDRRKLLAGSVVLDYLAANATTPLAGSIRELLAKGLTRPGDRALFSDIAHSATQAESAPPPEATEPVAFAYSPEVVSGQPVE